MKQYWRVGVWVLYTLAIGFVHFREAWAAWLLGMVLALVISLFDRLMYAWWLKPFEQLSIQIQYWIKVRDFVAVWRLLKDRGGEQSKLVLKSFGFAVIWPLLTLYVLTSTGSVIAAGIMMGLGLDLVGALVSDWDNPARISKWFFWQIKRSVSIKEVRIVASSYIFLWMLFSLILLIK